MTTMRRLRVVWNGLTGLPGVSTFYYGVASPDVSDAVGFFNTIKGLFPTPLSWDIPSSGDEIESTTGVLTGGWTGTGAGNVTATGATAYAAGVGARVQWQTDAIVNGRRVRGATFLAPLALLAYDTSGTLTNSEVVTMLAAANTFAASGVAKGIWHRNTPGGSDGVYANMIGATVPDRVTSLRSRRY